MTDVHAEHDRRTDEPYETGYQQDAEGTGYHKQPDQAEDFVPSDTGYDPAVDGPEDVSDRETPATAYGTQTDDEVTGDEVTGTVEDGVTADSDAVDSDAVDADARDDETEYVDAEVVDETPIGTPYGTPVPVTSGGPEGALPEDVTAADLTAADTADKGEPTELVEDPDALMTRWQAVQVSFVDDPAEALRDADGLVQQVIEQMQQRFVAERAEMEQQWSSGDDVSTEDMRLLLQKYRTFFNRLIKV